MSAARHSSKPKQVLDSFGSSIETTPCVSITFNNGRASEEHERRGDGARRCALTPELPATSPPPLADEAALGGLQETSTIVGDTIADNSDTRSGKSKKADDASASLGQFAKGEFLRAAWRSDAGG